MKTLHESFSSMDLLNQLIVKVEIIFSMQQYIITALERAHKRSSMIGLLGREGMGKSSAIAEYVLNMRNVYYVRIGESYRISNFMDEMIFQVSGVYPKMPDTLFIKMKQLSNFLTKDSSKKLIIVDDAGKLKPRGLGFFHELRDNTMQSTGFAFVGLEYFRKHLQQAIKADVTGVAEFYRRIESWYEIPPLKQNEISEYGLKHGLTEDQVYELKVYMAETEFKTISELESRTSLILEEAEEARKENRAPRKIGSKWKSSKLTDVDEELEDDLEELEEKPKKKKITRSASSV